MSNEQIRKEPKSTRSKTPKKYIITQKQLDAVEFPDHPMGINDFCNRLNEQLDLTVSKKLSGKILNDKLKKLGILSEEQSEVGKKLSVTNDTSARYGISMIELNYNGSPYQQIVFDKMGERLLTTEST